MAKKIEGYTPRGYSNANNGLWIFMDRKTDAPATVVIHEGRHKHERVFTESEVRAIIMDVLAQCFPDGEADGSHNDVVTAFGGHGIVLDPA